MSAGAQTNMRVQDFEGALAAADQALARTPDNVQLQIKRGILLRKLNRLEESLALLSDLAEARPDNLRVRHELALTLRRQGDYARSLQMSQDILREHQNHQPSILAVIDTNLLAQDFERALAAADKALELFPEDATIKSKRASILFALGDDSARIAELQSLFRADPSSPANAQALRAALVQNWRYEDADRVLRNYIETGGSELEARKQKIKFHLSIGEISKALGLANALLLDFPESTDAMLEVYNAKIRGLQLGDLDELEGRLMDLCPDSKQLAKLMAERRLGQLALDDAVAVLQAYLSQNPNSVTVRKLLGQLLLDIRDWNQFEILIRDRLSDLPFLAILFADRLIQSGAKKKALDILASLETAITSLQDSVAKGNILVSIHKIYRKIDTVSANRISELAQSLPHARPNVRHYFDMVASDNKSDTVESSDKTCPPLYDIVFCDAAVPSVFQPQHIALAKRIIPPGDDYDDWLQKLMKASNAARQTHLCYMQHPDAFESFESHIVFPDENILLDHARRSEALIITSSHIGPIIHTWWLKKILPKLRMISSYVSVRADSSVVGAQLIADGSSTSARAILDSINNGVPIAGSLDQPLRADMKFSEDRFSLPLQLFDFPPVRVSNLLPRLAWKYRLPSYWVDSHFKDGKVHINLARLPDRAEGTEFSQWGHYWMSEYASNLERCLHRGPENLNIPNPLFNLLLETFRTNAAASDVRSESERQSAKSF